MHAHTKGARVLHSMYGSGTVTETNEYHTVIDFDDHGPRRFATKLVALEPTSKPAPPRAVVARRRRKNGKDPA